MATRLGLYNEAAGALGERPFNSLTDNRPLRRRLDALWDGGWVKQVLEQGFWNHAMCTVELTYSPSVTPPFGYQYAFDKPEDWCKTFRVSSDPAFACELMQREDECAYWLANCDTIYVRYVSSDALYGGDLSRWPESFKVFAGHYGAWKATPQTTGSLGDKSELERTVKKLLLKSRANDAMNESPRQLPRGSWATSRGGGSRGDGGSNTNLIG